MKKLILSFSLFSIFLLLISSVHALSDWVLNPWFDNPNQVFDTGIIRNQIVSASPDSWKWGYSCYKWDNNGIYPIDWCRVNSYKTGTNDYNVYIAGDSLGTGDPVNNPLVGVVKLIQGNFGGSPPWYVPPKMSINNRDIYIDSWYNVVSYTGLHSAFMFDIWLKDDSNGNIMVLDLIFFTWTIGFPIRSPWWDEKVFHYQANVCGAGGWYHCNLKINQYIDDAISKAESQGVHFDRKTTYLYIAEILFEGIQSVGELDVGSFRLYWQPTSTTTTRRTTTTTIRRSRGGCPVLKVYDDNKLVTIGKIDIHSPKDQDIIKAVTFNMQPINGKHEVILDEAAYLFWDGSHIDFVRLTDETGKECKLISATHSKQGDILSAITTSDDVRVRTLPGERIKLTYDGCSGNQFTFSIEGYNRKLMWAGLSLSNIINFFKGIFGWG